MHQHPNMFITSDFLLLLLHRSSHTTVNTAIYRLGCSECLLQANKLNRIPTPNKTSSSPHIYYNIAMQNNNSSDTVSDQFWLLISGDKSNKTFRYNFQTCLLTKNCDYDVSSNQLATHVWSI